MLKQSWVTARDKRSRKIRRISMMICCLFLTSWNSPWRSRHTISRHLVIYLNFELDTLPVSYRSINYWVETTIGCPCVYHISVEINRASEATKIVFLVSSLIAVLHRNIRKIIEINLSCSNVREVFFFTPECVTSACIIFPLEKGPKSRRKIIVAKWWTNKHLCNLRAEIYFVSLSSDPSLTDVCDEWWVDDVKIHLYNWVEIHAEKWREKRFIIRQYPESLNYFDEKCRSR